MKKIISIICLCFVSAAAFAQGNFNEIRLGGIAASNITGCIPTNNLPLAQIVSAGAPGLNGTNGLQGAQGISGTNGAAGVSGTNGLPGTSGTNGATGAQGNPGTSGTNGIQGIPGISGTNGFPVGDAKNLTNFTGLTFTNTTTFITQGGTVTAAANGEVFINLMVTNAQLVVLTNKTSHAVRWMGTRTGNSTNTDNCSMWVHAGDQITLTNWSGAGGATLLWAEFDVLK